MEKKERHYERYLKEGNCYEPIGETRDILPSGFYKPVYDSYHNRVYLASKEVWLVYATFVSLGLGFIVLIILTVVLINRRRELTLLNNLENFQNHQKIKIDDNYFCPNCKKMVSKDDNECPYCKNKFH